MLIFWNKPLKGTFRANVPLGEEGTEVIVFTFEKENIKKSTDAGIADDSTAPRYLPSLTHDIARYAASNLPMRSHEKN
jgi:hypothetical protein